MSLDSDLPFEEFPLVDAIDHDILMHRDAHFGGQFSIMLDYYAKEGKGVQPEFDLSRITRLADLEKELKQNLAALFLASPEIQKITDARTLYQNLKSLYEKKEGKTSYPKLIADLILAEAEEEESAIQAIVEKKNEVVPALIEVLRSEELYDPVFPGYGNAPFLAVQCLGKIGDKRAIISLFQALGEGDFFADDQIVDALHAIGQPSRDFLLQVIKGKPLNEDNEKAAIGLIAFKEDEEVANACFDLLQLPDFQKDPCLSTYLALICAGLKDKEKQNAFSILAKNLSPSSNLKKDMESAMQEWNER